MSIFEVSHIKIPKDYLSSKRVRAMILNAMKQEGSEMVMDLNSTTEYWVHKPHFVKHISYKGGDIILSAGVSGSNRANKYWNYVDKGTTRRYVIFHPFYSPKTQVPGQFYSNTPGAYTKNIKGNPADSKIQGVSNKALSGIRARNWTALLRREHKMTFARKITEAIRRGLEPK